MGGRGSGRTRTHTSINDCLVLDMAWLRKRKLLNKEKCTFEIEWSRWTELDFAERKTSLSRIGARYRTRPDQPPTLTLFYRTSRTSDDEESEVYHDHNVTIHLISTPCTYGNVRYWFTAPCCGKRVRVLYISTKSDNLRSNTPQCRTCLGVHYASQLQSYVEQHKTYEKYLLSNWGYSWTHDAYRALKQHYLEVTPEIEYIKARNMLDRELHFIRLYMRSNQILFRGAAHAASTLRSADEREMIIAHYEKEISKDFANALRAFVHAHNLKKAARREAYRLMKEQAHEEARADELEQINQERESIGDLTDYDILVNASLIAWQRDLELELEELDRHKPQKDVVTV